MSSVTGGIGTGKKLFNKEDAERLATELNSSYPDIDHEAVPAVAAVEPALAAPGPDGALAATAAPAAGSQAVSEFPQLKGLAALSS